MGPARDLDFKEAKIEEPIVEKEEEQKRVETVQRTEVDETPKKHSSFQPITPRKKKEPEPEIKPEEPRFQSSQNIPVTPAKKDSTKQVQKQSGNNNNMPSTMVIVSAVIVLVAVAMKFLS